MRASLWLYCFGLRGFFVRGEENCTTRCTFHGEPVFWNLAGRMLAKRGAPISFGLVDSCVILRCLCYAMWFCVARNRVALRYLVLVPRCWRPCCDALWHGALRRDALCNASFLCCSRLGKTAPCCETSWGVALAMARFSTLPYPTLRYSPLRYAVLNYFALRRATLRHATLRYEG